MIAEIQFWVFLVPFVLVPLLIHLFNFKKSKLVPFSKVEVLLTSTIISKRRKKVKYLLLLLLRTSIISFFLFLIFFQGDNKSTGRVSVWQDSTVSTSIFKNSLEAVYSEAPFDGVTIHHLPTGILGYTDLKTNNILISDFQKGSYWIFDSLSSSNAVGTIDIVYLGDINKKRNISIDSLYAFFQDEQYDVPSIRCEFDLSKALVRGSVAFKLFQDQQQIGAVVKAADQLDYIDFAIESEGTYHLRMEGDDVAFDDDFYFTVGSTAKLKILVLSDGDIESNLSKVFNDDYFDVSIRHLRSIHYDELEKSDYVIFDAVNTIPESLHAYSHDLRFIIFPGDKVDLASYRSFLSADVQLSSGALSEISLEKGSSTLFNNILNKFSDDLFLPSEKPYFSSIAESEILLFYRNGDPFLFKKKDDYIFNFSYTDSIGALPSHPLFLPLIYEITLLSEENGKSISYYYPLDTIELSLKKSEYPIRLVRHGFEVIPEANRNANSIFVKLPKNLGAGHYWLVQASDTLQAVSLNVPKSESVMEGLSFDELQLIAEDVPNIQAVYRANDVDLKALVGGDSTTVSVWKYALLLALALIVSETFFHRFSRYR